MVAAESLQKVDPKQEFTVYLIPETKCTPTPSQILSCPARQVHEHVAKEGLVPTDFVLFGMLHAGVTLWDHPTKSWAELASHFLQLYRGLLVLQKAQLIHRDLHRGNLMYSSTDGRARIIDFGKSFAAAVDRSDWDRIEIRFDRRAEPPHTKDSPDWWLLTHSRWNMRRLYGQLQKVKQQHLMWMREYPEWSVFTSSGQPIEFRDDHPLVVYLRKRREWLRVTNDVDQMNYMLFQGDVFTLSQTALDFWHFRLSKEEKQRAAGLRSVFAAGCHPDVTERWTASTLVERLVQLLED